MSSEEFKTPEPVSIKAILSGPNSLNLEVQAKVAWLT